MEIVEDRYQNAAILITSQLPVDKWHDVIGEPTFADAILDRIVHNAHRINLDGPSMRKTKKGRPAKTYSGHCINRLKKYLSFAALNLMATNAPGIKSPIRKN